MKKRRKASKEQYNFAITASKQKFHTLAKQIVHMIYT